MSRRVWRSIPVLALLALPGTGPAGAQAFRPLLTEQYVREAGTPVTVRRTFTTCDPGGLFRLVVVNGPGGRAPVSAASVWLNGLEIVTEGDLNQQVSRLEQSLGGLRSENVLEVRVRSGPGGVLALTIEGAEACGARITSPAPGATVPAGLLLVHGTLATPGETAVGITVNGVAGLVEADRFAALVPVDPAVTSLAVEVNDFAGTRSRDSVPITVVAADEAAVRLLPGRAAGTPPLTTGFTVSSLAGVSQVVLDADGDGVADFTGPSLAGQTFTYPRPGLYLPRVQVTDVDGATHTAATIVHVVDPVALDLRLQAVWAAVKDAIRAGNLPDAARFLHTDTRDRYHAQLARLSPPTLANIDRHLTDIRLVEIGLAGAQYEMVRLRDGDPLSFAVWFQLDQDGLWRLRRF